jgi:hypothetical protein
MMWSVQVVVVLIVLVSAAIGQSPSSSHAVFTASNGGQIELDTRAETFVTPRSRGTRLEDCGNKAQVCLTDHHGFAFAYFRTCNDAEAGNYKHLRFHPKVASALHNTDVWLVYDASPNYLFHYAYSKGIIGIYVGPTASFDFRSVLHDRNFQLDRLDSLEYRLTGPDTVAACNAGPDASEPLPLQQSAPVKDTLLHESGHTDPPKPE